MERNCDVLTMPRVWTCTLYVVVISVCPPAELAERFQAGLQTTIWKYFQTRIAAYYHQFNVRPCMLKVHGCGEPDWQYNITSDSFFSPRCVTHVPWGTCRRNRYVMETVWTVIICEFEQGKPLFRVVHVMSWVQFQKDTISKLWKVMSISASEV